MPTPSPADRAAFLSAYAKTLVASWADPSFADRLVADPVPALAANGISVPAGVPVTVVRLSSADTRPDASDGAQSQFELYEKALTGQPFTLYLPDPPRIDEAELSASELHGVAAGGIWDPYCCSCCPTCCSAAGYGG